MFIEHFSEGLLLGLMTEQITNKTFIATSLVDILCIILNPTVFSQCDRRSYKHLFLFDNLLVARNMFDKKKNPDSCTRQLIRFGVWRKIENFSFFIFFCTIKKRPEAVMFNKKKIKVKNPYPRANVYLHTGWTKTICCIFYFYYYHHSPKINHRELLSCTVKTSRPVSENVDNKLYVSNVK